VFARNGEGDLSDRTGELVAIHTDGFDTYATELLGTIGVDSACAGIWDKACPKRDRDAPVDEGVQAGSARWRIPASATACIPSTRQDPRIVVKLRLGFLDVPRSIARSRRRSTAVASIRRARMFALGEMIEHPKFGAGTVTAVSDGGKIDVTFADGKRTLVHGK